MLNNPLIEKLRKPIAAIVISVSALGAIKGYEGYKSEAYVPVPGDVLTIGYGTTKKPDGEAVQKSDIVDKQLAEVYLKNDISIFAKEISKCIKVPISQGEYDAFISLTYNIGSGAFCKSTLVKKLNTYDYAGACNEILKWDKFKGVPLKGLTIRRTKEYNQCIGKE